MKITRRKFLGVGSLAAGAILQFKGPVTAQIMVPSSISHVDVIEQMSVLRWDSFYQFIYTDFTFGHGGNAVPLKLVEMIDTTPAGTKTSSGQECFMMKFQGPSFQTLSQGTYPVVHFNLGNFDLFITDGGQVGRAHHYIAVVNHINA